MLRRSLWVLVMVVVLTTAAIPAVADELGTFVDQSSRARFIAESDALVTHVATIDHGLDQDNDLFITIGNANGDQTERNRVLQNNGQTLGRSVALSRVATGDFNHVAFGDLDGDGADDAILSLTLSPARLLLFRPDRNIWVDRSTGRIPADQPNDVTIGSELLDCDLDGDLDVMTAVENPFIAAGSQNRLYLNNGTARFTDGTSPRLPSILDDSAALAVGDFDSDGDPDVINVNAGPDFYLENDGTCRFTDQSATRLPAQPADRDSGRDAVVADFDSDGDLDVVFAISRGEVGPVLWINDGQGVFTDETTARIPVSTLSTQAIVGCDLEADGDLDLVLANSGAVLQPPTSHLFAGAPEKILVNDGTGTFVDESSRLPQVNDGSQTVACADVSGDGRPDIITGNGKGEPLKVYVQQ